MSIGLHLFLVFVHQWVYFLLGTEQPKMNYHNPVDIPMYLAANFGELRSNHFHMGLDIKTQGREGFKLYSIDKGYVSRINVSPYGYGLAIYVNHPGGVTSVYAHCSAFSDKIQQKVRAVQKQWQSSEVEIYFLPNELPVERGEVIGLSGNSGSSRGPHLHFEIRDTQTDAPINPLHFGFEIADSRPPVLYGIRLYALDEFGYILDDPKAYTPKKSGDQYYMDTLRVPASFIRERGGLGWAIATQDFFDGYEHTGAPYKIELLIEGAPFITTQFDRIKFAHTRYLNEYTDPFQRLYHRSFQSITNPLQLYNSRTSGIFKPKAGQSYKMQYKVSDYAGNTSVCSWILTVDQGEFSPSDSKVNAPDYIQPNQDYFFENPSAQLIVPKGLSYQPFPKQMLLSEEVVELTCGHPVQNPFVVKMRPMVNFPVSKQYIQVNGRRALATQFVDGWLEAKSVHFGKMSVAIDQNAPTIAPINLRKTISAKQYALSWRIQDRDTGLKDYGLWVNGEWYVLRYESKGAYAYIPTAELPSGELNLRVTAIDHRGNTAEWTGTILN